MKKIKKNQVIITALAIMIAVAGYINYTGNLSDIISVKDTKDASSDGVVIDENTGEIVNNDAEPDDNSLMEPGSVMLTSGSSVSDSIISEAKLNREQLRAKNKEMLMEIVNNESLDEAAKQAAERADQAGDRYAPHRRGAGRGACRADRGAQGGAGVGPCHRRVLSFRVARQRRGL